MTFPDDDHDYESDEYSVDESSVSATETENEDEDESVLAEPVPASKVQIVDEDSITVVGVLNMIDGAVDAMINAIIPNENLSVINSSVEKDFLTRTVTKSSPYAQVGVFPNLLRPKNDMSKVDEKNGTEVQKRTISSKRSVDEKYSWPTRNSFRENADPSISSSTKEGQVRQPFGPTRGNVKSKKDSISSNINDAQGDLWSFPLTMMSKKDILIQNHPEKKKNILKGKKNASSSSRNENSVEKNIWSFASLMTSKEETQVNQPPQKKKGFFKRRNKNNTPSPPMTANKDFWSIPFLMASKREDELQKPPEKNKGFFQRKKRSSNNNTKEDEVEDENDFWDNVLNLVSPETESESTKQIVMPSKNKSNRNIRSNHTDERDDVHQRRSSLFGELRA